MGLRSGRPLAASARSVLIRPGIAWGRVLVSAKALSGAGMQTLEGS
jgi:hypothetical protein